MRCLASLKKDAAACAVQYPQPGTYISRLKVTDARGRIDFDFARAKIFSRTDIDTQPPRVHLSYFPTLDLKPGTEITFKARAFNNTANEETWDFGDGSPLVTTRSDGNVDQHADGYVTVRHSYERADHYLVHVSRPGADGSPAEDRLHIHIED